MPLSIAHQLAQHGPSVYSERSPWLAWYTDRGEVVAVAVQTPPHPLIVSPLSTAATRALAAVRGRPDRVLAEARTATALARSWGARERVQVRQRLHRLTELVEPEADGATRVARRADAGQLWSWHAAFHAEVLPDDPPPREARFEADLTQQRFLVHEVAGRPVAMARVGPPDLGVSRIGHVFTPVERRGHGHGAAVTAGAVREAQRRGAIEVVLFTDLANSTSNALYARLGFVGLFDLAVAELIAGDQP